MREMRGDQFDGAADLLLIPLKLEEGTKGADTVHNFPGMSVQLSNRKRR